jgi:putative molybdopterin biosynthesis protein
MRLAQQFPAGIQDAHRVAGLGIRRIGDVRAKDPGVSGKKSIRAFARNRNCLFQELIVVIVLVSRVAEVRKLRGISAVELAAQAGITRQAVYAIESGTYMPNTAVALRIARTLETSVEALFSLGSEEANGLDVVEFEALDPAIELTAGEPIQVCKVGKRHIGVAPSRFPAYLPVADGIIRQANEAALTGNPENESRLLIAGCDPALSLLAAYAAGAGVDIVLANTNSARSLEWLGAGRIDIAGTHLHNAINDPRRKSPGLTSINFARWEEGLVVRRGNPKAIRSVNDLTNPKVLFMNRDIGSASRRLFESELARAGLTAAGVAGSESSAPGHLAAAWAVASGQADCCIAARSAALRFGLGFIPLAAEQFDLVLPRKELKRKSVQALLEVLNRSRFRRQLEMIAGYDISAVGMQD